MDNFEDEQPLNIEPDDIELNYEHYPNNEYRDNNQSEFTISNQTDGSQCISNQLLPDLGDTTGSGDTSVSEDEKNKHHINSYNVLNIDLNNRFVASKQNKSKIQDQNQYCLNDTYYDNYNILAAHSSCVRYLKEKCQNKVSELTPKVQNLSDELNDCKDSVDKVTMLNMNKNLKKLQTELLDWKNEKIIENYKNKVNPIITRYKKIKNSCDLRDKTVNNEILILIDKFLSYSSEFVPVNVRRLYRKHNACESCGEVINIQNSSSPDIIICENCGCVTSNLSGINYHKNDKTGRQYHSKENYYISLQQLQGKVEIKSRNTLEKVMNELDQYFIRKGIGDRYSVRQRPLTTTKDEMLEQQGKEPYYIYHHRYSKDCFKVRKDTNIIMLREALKDIGRNAWYRWIYYIAMEYWHWDLIDLSAAEERKILEKYDEFMKYYNAKKTLRTSSPNTNYLNYVLLNDLGYIITKKDINIVSSSQTINDYLHNLAPIFRELGYNHVPI